MTKTARSAKRRACRSLEPGAVDAAEPLMTRDGLARLFAVTPGAITRWARDGMPVATGGGSGRQAHYRPSACVAWRLAQLEAKYAGMEGLNPPVERAKRDRAQARLAEQLHRRREGDLLEIAEVTRAWALIVVAVRARLLAMPHALADRCAHATTPAEVAAILKGEVYDALRELAAWHPPAERAEPRDPAPGSAPGARRPR